MSIKRVFISIWSRIDQSLSTLENHDAVAKAVIAEIKQNRAKAFVRFKKLEDDHKKLNTQIEANRANIELWTQRAKDTAESNEAKALECLKRRRALQATSDRLEVQYQEQKGLIRRIEDDIKQIDAKIEELEQKRSAFRTRAASAAAHKNIALLNDNFGHDVDDIFSAWDEKLSIHESQSQCSTQLEDALLSEFSAQEELLSLKNELSELTK
jgi:phage shock protein A